MISVRKIFIILLALTVYASAFASTNRAEVLSTIVSESGLIIKDPQAAIAHILDTENRTGRKLSKQEVVWTLREFAEPPEDPAPKKKRCFTCAMRILTPAGYVRLDAVKVGDAVYSWDEQRHKLVVNEVSQVHLAKDVPYGKLLNTPTGITLEVTAGHPFYLPEASEYRDLDQIGQNEKLLTIAFDGAKCEPALMPRGAFQVEKIADVMTLSMKNLPHNFVVEGMVVHNKPIF